MSARPTESVLDTNAETLVEAGGRAPRAVGPGGPPAARAGSIPAGPTMPTTTQQLDADIALLAGVLAAWRTDDLALKRAARAGGTVWITPTPARQARDRLHHRLCGLRAARGDIVLHEGS